MKQLRSEAVHTQHKHASELRLCSNFQVTTSGCNQLMPGRDVIRSNPAAGPARSSMSKKKQ